MGRVVVSERALRRLLPFLVVLIVCLPAAAEAAPEGSLSGIVLSGPSCPAVRLDSPCPDRPLKTGVIVRSPSGRVVSSLSSDEKGEFFLSLPEGEYRVEAASSRGPKWMPESSPVRILPGKTTSIKLFVDTGIR